MTELSFHSNVADVSGHACRLLRKAVRLGSRVVVTGPDAALKSLDRELWTFEPLEFIPHVMPRAGETMPPRFARTPVWLTQDPVSAPHHDVLVNLGSEVPPGFDRFARLIEVVSAEADAVAAGRARWKLYLSHGLTPRHHDMAAEGSR